MSTCCEVSEMPSTAKQFCHCIAGRVVIHNIKTHDWSEDTKCHSCQVTHLLWDTAGSFLASADAQGVAVLWKVDLHCKLSLLATFKTTPSRPISAMLFDTSAAVPALYYSISAGTCTDIHSGNSSGEYSKLYTVPTMSPLLGLFWYDNASQLVSVAASGELFVHGSRAQETRQWELVMKLRIDAGVKSAGDKSKLMVAWVADHTLASASGQDSMIHMYNMETEDNYVLQIG